MNLQYAHANTPQFLQHAQSSSITPLMKIHALCFSLGCLPLLVILLIGRMSPFSSKTNNAQRHTLTGSSASQQSICAFLPKPTTTFGAGRQSPNVQLHVTFVVVLLVIIIILLLLLDNHTARSAGRHSAHQLDRSLLSSTSSSSSPLAMQLLLQLCATNSQIGGKGWGWGGSSKGSGAASAPKPNVAGVSATPQDRFRLTRTDT